MILSQDCIDSAIERGETPHIISDEKWKRYAFIPAVIRMVNQGYLDVEMVEEPKPQPKSKPKKKKADKAPVELVEVKDGEL